MHRLDAVGPQGEERLRHGFPESGRPRHLLGPEEEDRRAAARHLRTGQRDEILQGPALGRAARARRQADVNGAIGQKPGGVGMEAGVDVEFEARRARKGAPGGDLQEVQHLALHAFGKAVARRRFPRRQQEARRRRDEGLVRHAPQAEAGPENTLSVDDQIEAPPAEGAPEKLARMEPDAGVLDDLVEEPGHQRRHDPGVDAGLLARHPGDAGVGEGLAQAAREGQLQEPVPDAVEADVDHDGSGRRLPDQGGVPPITFGA